jgi:acid stress-induced BolA-like protein IbaG/YrbA
MALKILSSPSQPDAIAEQIRRSIESALAGARAEVRAASPGHFEIRVAWAGFAGASKLQQHQQVYRAITPLLSGDAAPVHAIDRLECRLAP